MTFTVTIDAEVTPVLSYAMAHNAIAFISDLMITTSGSDCAGVEVSIEVRDSEGVVSQPWQRLVDLSSGEQTRLTDVRPLLDPAALLQVDERRPAQVVVVVSKDGETLGQRTFAVSLLAGQQWLADPPELGAELLAAFVMPNHPAVAALLAEASELLRAKTGSSSMEGYQRGEHRVDEIAEAVFDAMQARRIRYSNPPASWGDVGQKVRTPSQVLDERVGTCLDTTTVMAAALEQAGLHPLMWLVEGHIFTGYWRQDGHLLPETVTADASPLVNAVDLGLVQLVETTMLTEREEPVPFEATHRPPYERYLTGDLLEVTAVIDVVTARRSGILPLPARTRDADGAVHVTEYRPTAGSSSLTASPAAGSAASRATGSASAAPRSRPAPPARVQHWKNALLDLSLRNRLINYRDSSGYALAVPTGHLGRLEDLISEGTALDLLPRDRFDKVLQARGVTTASELPAEQLAESLVRGRQLYVDISTDNYTSRLQMLAHKARTVLEETGANNLYLALGSLVWDIDGAPVRSPLILVPVRLVARSRQQLYRLQLDDSGASTPNYCLLEKLRQVHGLEVPEFAEPVDDSSGIDLQAVFTSIRTALAAAGLPFRVEETAQLAILQFAKFRLWKDLDENWEVLTKNALVRHLVHDPSDPFDDPAAPVDDDGASTSADPDLDVLAGWSPVPADATQLAAIADAVAGRTFVLEGPPGTGKSQTITNLLARCLAEGRRVLFVAEKRAALDVVRDRLDAVGMGPFSLDLHDKGSSPVAVRRQVKAALEHHVEVDEQGLTAANEDLTSARRTLARYAQRLHETNGAGLSLYSARSTLLALGGGDDEPALPVPAALLEDGGRDHLTAARRSLAELPDTADPASPSPNHPWGFVTHEPSRVDVDAAWAAAVDVDAHLGQAPSTGPLARALAAVKHPSELAAAVALLSGQPMPLDQLDAVRAPAWAGEARSALSAASALASAPHPTLQLVTPEVFALPLSQIATSARDAAASSWFGRKKRQRAVLAQLAPGLRSGAEVPLTALAAVAAELAHLQTERAAVRAQLERVPGMAPPPSWDPLVPGDRDAAEQRVAWLTAAAPAVDPSTPVGAALREHVASDGAGVDLGPLEQALQRLLAATSADTAGLAAWCGDRGLLDRWRSTSAARATGDARRQSLTTHLAFLEALEPLRRAGLVDAHTLLRTGTIAAEDAARALDRGVALASLDERREATGLARFSPSIHGRAVERFATSSRAVREHLEAELPRQVLAARPFDARAGRGRIGELHHEVGKQRRGLGVRALMSTYGDLITQVMPCVLVSPDSLSRFFPARAGLFDLVVFDEASQIRVADAVGAMGRARSVVVVGDSKQMPPTSFGDSTDATDDDAPAAEFAVVEDQESILSECVLARVPQRWLSWHYRSQDESLIAFSNRHYYDDKLSSFPAPSAVDDDRGVSLVRVDGHFHRSGAGKQLRTNPVEADAVVAEIRRRFNAAPGQTPSIGVVTFNQQQRALIESLLRATGDDRLVEALDDAAEGLFVKNLENVQGDERDVILFSTGFSTNAQGVLPLNFGPLNRTGGERRLNVAVTRARRRVLVFSSFDPAQLRAEETSSLGIKHLRAYLDLAARGTGSLGVSARRLAVADRHRDDVAAALRARGLVVSTDVGLSDFKVDISVSLPEEPERSRVAVFLDGPGWAVRRTVGDRDGLPVEVLSRLLRWPAVERVWLPSWLDDPTATVEAIERAARRPVPVSVAPHAAPPVTGASSLPSSTPEVLPAVAAPELVGPPERQPVMSTVAAAPQSPTASAPGLPGEISFTAWEPAVTGPRTVLDQLPQPGAVCEVRRALAAAVAAEGPVQAERLGRLVAGAFGLTRVNEARSRSILDALPPELQARVVDGFVWPEHLEATSWTGFRRSAPGEARPVEQVSLREIGNAMVALCASSGGMDRDELCREALLVFGGLRVTAGIATRLNAALDAAVLDGRLTAFDGSYRAV